MLIINLNKFMLVLFFLILAVLNGFGQNFLPTIALQDSFQGYDPNPVTWMSRWKKNSLSNCSANQSVVVEYSPPDPNFIENRTLNITPLSNTSGLNVNGFVSKYNRMLSAAKTRSDSAHAVMSPVSKSFITLTNQSVNGWLPVREK